MHVNNEGPLSETQTIFHLPKSSMSTEVHLMKGWNGSRRHRWVHLVQQLEKDQERSEHASIQWLKFKKKADRQNTKSQNMDAQSIWITELFVICQMLSFLFVLMHMRIFLCGSLLFSSYHSHFNNLLGVCVVSVKDIICVVQISLILLALLKWKINLAAKLLCIVFQVTREAAV